MGGLGKILFRWACTPSVWSPYSYTHVPSLFVWVSQLYLAVSVSPSPSSSASASVSPSQTPQYQLEINFGSTSCVTDNCIDVVPWNEYSVNFDVKFERRVYDDATEQFVIQNIEPENWDFFNLDGIKIFSRVPQDCYEPSGAATICQDSIAAYQGLIDLYGIATFTQAFGTSDIQQLPPVGILPHAQDYYDVSYFCSGNNVDKICSNDFFVPTWLSVDDDGSGQPVTYSPKVYDAGVYPNTIKSDSQKGYAGVVDCRDVMDSFWSVNTSFTIQKYVVLVEQPISSTGVPGPCEVWVDGSTYCVPEGRVSSAITFGSQATQDYDGNILNLETNLVGDQTTPRYSSFNCPSVSVKKKEDF